MEQNEKIKVLIVDDVDSNRFTLRDIVKDMGYQPILAENGEQALKIINRFQVRLILLDVAMPIMDGYELCRILKHNPDKRDIPVIFISAFDDPEDIVKGFELGGEDYITKPFIKEVVNARIAVHMKAIESSRNMHDINLRLQTSLTNHMNQMESEKRNVLYAMIRILREAAFYDADEMNRLSENCRIFSEALQLTIEYGDDISDNFLDLIEVLCMLRDLGLISVPTELARKENRTEEEEKKLGMQTKVAVEILEDIKKNTDYNDSVNMAIEIAGSYLEKFDGTGYPNGLMADEIPLSAQVVSIISEFNRKTKDKNADINKALEDIQSEAGRKFNPILVEVILKIGKRLK